MKKKIVSLVLVLVLMAALVPTFASAKDVPLYGRAGLATLQNKDNLLKAYDIFYTHCENRAASTSIASLALNGDEFLQAFSAYYYDHPEHFRVTYNISSYAGKISTDYIGFENMDTAKAAFEERVSFYLNKVSGITDQRELALKLHDLLCENVIYYETGRRAHSPYGALVDGYAVCEGYARAYQLLMNRMGIECFMVDGESQNEGHAWNYVKLNGSWVIMDVTWDDQNDSGGFIGHRYFAATDSIINLDHTVNTPAYGLPACTDASMRCYSTARSNSLATLSVSALAAAAVPDADNNRVILFEYTGVDSQENVVQWIKDNYVNTAKALGFTYGSIGRSIACTEYEYRVLLSGDFPPAESSATGLFENGKLGYKGYLTENANIICVCYNTDGKLMGMELIEAAKGAVEGVTSITKTEGYTYKLFVVDGNSVPLCDCWAA